MGRTTYASKLSTTRSRTGSRLSRIRKSRCSSLNSTISSLQPRLSRMKSAVCGSLLKTYTSRLAKKMPKSSDSKCSLVTKRPSFVCVHRRLKPVCITRAKIRAPLPNPLDCKIHAMGHLDTAVIRAQSPPLKRIYLSNKRATNKKLNIFQKS